MKLNNNLVNSYWEANLPANYQKPAMNCPSSEVQNFQKDKYQNGKWADKK